MQTDGIQTKRSCAGNSRAVLAPGAVQRGTPPLLSRECRQDAIMLASWLLWSHARCSRTNVEGTYTPTAWCPPLGLVGGIHYVRNPSPHWRRCALNGSSRARSSCAPGLRCASSAPSGCEAHGALTRCHGTTSPNQLSGCSSVAASICGFNGAEQRRSRCRWRHLLRDQLAASVAAPVSPDRCEPDPMWSKGVRCMQQRSVAVRCVYLTHSITARMGGIEQNGASSVSPP
jgi:hypothetical protein